MVEPASAYKSESEASGGPFDTMSEATLKVKENVEKLVEGFDLQSIVKRVEEFGRDNPVGLALAALTLGVAAGVLMRPPKQIHPH